MAFQQSIAGYAQAIMEIDHACTKNIPGDVFFHRFDKNLFCHVYRGELVSLKLANRYELLHIKSKLLALKD